MSDGDTPEPQVVDDLLRQGAEQTRQGVEQTRQGVDLTQQGVTQVEQAAAITVLASDHVQTRQDLDTMLESPRLNERYFGKVSRWRVMQITALVFAAVTMFGFWQARNDRNDRQRDQCELVADGREGIRDLLDQLLTVPDPTPAQLARAEASRAKALEVLPPVEWRDGMCRPVLP